MVWIILTQLYEFVDLYMMGEDVFLQNSDLNSIKLASNSPKSTIGLPR